jgi:hypothetical protein
VRVIKADLKRLGGLSLAFSPDSKLLVAAGYRKPPAVSMWEVETGKELQVAPDPPGNGYDCVSFSPDGKWLALGCHDGTVRLWDHATGRELRTLQRVPALKPESGTVAIAFSADGRNLAASNGRDIRIWEIVTGKERRRLAAAASCLAFAPNSLTLASGGWDTTALLWDLTGASSQGPGKPVQPSAQELARLWADLAGDDVPAAYRALGRLSAAPEPSVPYIRERTRPVAADEALIARKIADLESDRFEVREEATRELEERGDLAEPALRKVLTMKPSLEIRRRVEALLDKQEKRLLSGERLRAWRAVEVLEAIGTPEARQVLEKLAQGAEAAQLTREARAALDRLGKWPPVSP